MNQEFGFSCPRCQIGRCNPSTSTYVRLHHGAVISAPDTPSFQCDVCGYTEFQQAAVRNLQSMIGYDDDRESGEAHDRDMSSLNQPSSTDLSDGKKPTQTDTDF